MRSEAEFRDRIKRLAIVAMVSDDDLLERLVLKGGNLLDIAYGISTRASVDIDFSVDGTLDSIPDVERRVEKAIISTFEGEGLRAFDFKMKAVPPNLTDNMKSFWGGYKVSFKVIEAERYKQIGSQLDNARKQALPIGKGDSRSFTIDISNHEYCGAKVAKNVDGYTVFGYSPAMVVAEKMRAVCQQMPDYVKVVKSNPRARARDFVDIKIVADEYEIDFRDESFRATLAATFAAKNVPLDLLNCLGDFREYHRGDFRLVEETVKPGVTLRSYDFYFNFLLANISKLESFWNK